MGVPEKLNWRNPSWAGRQPSWLHGWLLAPLSPFSLPHPALLGLLAGFELGQEQWNAMAKARQWVVHEVPPEMSGACPGRAEKGSSVNTCLNGICGAHTLGDGQRYTEGI